jgi:hypothetical protein
MESTSIVGTAAGVPRAARRSPRSREAAAPPRARAQPCAHRDLRMPQLVMRPRGGPVISAPQCVGETVTG